MQERKKVNVDQVAEFLKQCSEKKVTSPDFQVLLNNLSEFSTLCSALVEERKVNGILAGITESVQRKNILKSFAPYEPPEIVMKAILRFLKFSFFLEYDNTGIIRDDRVESIMKNLKKISVDEWKVIEKKCEEGWVFEICPGTIYHAFWPNEKRLLNRLKGKKIKLESKAGFEVLLMNQFFLRPENPFLQIDHIHDDFKKYQNELLNYHKAKDPKIFKTEIAHMGHLLYSYINYYINENWDPRHDIYNHESNCIITSGRYGGGYRKILSIKKGIIVIDYESEKSLLSKYKYKQKYIMPVIKIK